MAEASEPVAPSPELNERLSRLEQAISSIQVHSAHAAVAANESGMAGLIPSAVLGAMIPGLAPSPPEFAAGFPIFKEFQIMARMYIDARYRLSRLGQFGVPLVLILAVLNYLTFQFAWPVPVVAPIFERIFLFILAIALYKILNREAARYASVLAYLARFGASA